MVYSDGTIYEGNWHEGKQNGKGIFTNKQGNKTQSLWQNGIVVS